MASSTGKEAAPGLFLKPEEEIKDVTENILTPQVVTKYQTAATICNNAMNTLKLQVKEGVTVGHLCNIGIY
jgi:hypothetical protein